MTRREGSAINMAKIKRHFIIYIVIAALALLTLSSCKLDFRNAWTSPVPVDNTADGNTALLPSEAPASEAPAIDAPTIDAPVTDAPATDAPVTDAPATDAPATDAPVTNAPVTNAPVTNAPLTGITFGFEEKHLLPGDELRLAVYRRDGSGDPAGEVGNVTFSVIENGMDEYGTALYFEENRQLKAWHPGTCTVNAVAADGAEASFRLYVKGINSIKLSSSYVEMAKGSEKELVVSVNAIDTDGTFEYTIDRPDVVSFDGRTLKGLATGLAQITFTTSDPARTISCTVSVASETAYIPLEERTEEDIRLHTPGDDFKHTSRTDANSDSAFEGVPGISYDVTKYKLVRIVVRDDSKRDHFAGSHEIPAGVSIAAVDASGRRVNFGYTNINSAAAMALPVGEYSFKLETPVEGFLPYFRTNVCRVSSKARYTNVELHLFPADEYSEKCTITVRDEHGIPLPGAEVYLSDRTEGSVPFVTDGNGMTVINTPLYYYAGTGYTETVQLYIKAPGYIPLHPQRIPRSVAAYDAVMISADTVNALAVAVNELERSVIDGFLWFVDGGNEIEVDNADQHGTFREVLPGYSPDDILNRFSALLPAEYLTNLERSDFYAYLKSRYYFDGSKYYYNTAAPKYRASTDSDYRKAEYIVDSERLSDPEDISMSISSEYKYSITIPMKLAPGHNNLFTENYELYNFVFENGSWRICWYAV